MSKGPGSNVWKQYLTEKRGRVMLRRVGVVSVMVNWEEAAGHNPHFYCLLTGFPATLPALSRIALGHESLTSPGR